MFQICKREFLSQVFKFTWSNIKKKKKKKKKAIQSENMWKRINVYDELSQAKHRARIVITKTR